MIAYSGISSDCGSVDHTIYIVSSGFFDEHWRNVFWDIPPVDRKPRPFWTDFRLQIEPPKVIRPIHRSQQPAKWWPVMGRDGRGTNTRARK